MSLQHGIRDHNELRHTVSRTFLYDLGDAYIVVSENSRDIRQSARLVRNLKAEEISRSRLLDRFYRIILICNAAVPSTVVMDDISHDNDDITHDSAGRRHLSCTASHEHRVIAGLTMDKHCVERIADCRERMLLRDQHRVNLDLDLIVHQLCDTEKFDHIVEFLCIADVIGGDLCDPFHVDIFECHLGVECQGGHDRDLSARIVTFHISRRIRLRVAKFRRLRERFLIIHSLFRHFRQNVVRGPVDDSHDLRQHTSCKTLL